MMQIFRNRNRLKNFRFAHICLLASCVLTHGSWADVTYYETNTKNQNQVTEAYVKLDPEYHPVHHFHYFRQVVAETFDGTALSDVIPDYGMNWPEVDAQQTLPNTLLQYRSPMAYSIQPLGESGAPILLDGSETLKRSETLSGEISYNIEARVLDYKKPAIYRHLLAAKAGFDLSENEGNTSQSSPNPAYLHLAERAIAEYSIDERGIRSDYLQAVAVARWLTENGTNLLRNPALITGFGELAERNDMFAQITALSIRSLGFPSRVAYGYVVAKSPNNSRDTLTIRADTFRAWSEIHIQNFGWVPVDVCPFSENKLSEQLPCY